MTTIRIRPAQAVVVRELRRDGASNKQIARRLNLSVETVKSHLQAVYAATGCHDRTSLVLAITTGRITLDPDVTQEIA